MLDLLTLSDHRKASKCFLEKSVLSREKRVRIPDASRRRSGAASKRTILIKKKLDWKSPEKLSSSGGILRSSVPERIPSTTAVSAAMLYARVVRLKIVVESKQPASEKCGDGLLFAVCVMKVI